MTNLSITLKAESPAERERDDKPTKACLPTSQETLCVDTKTGVVVSYVYPKRKVDLVQTVKLSYPA